MSIRSKDLACQELYTKNSLSFSKWRLNLLKLSFQIVISKLIKWNQFRRLSLKIMRRFEDLE